MVQSAHKSLATVGVTFVLLVSCNGTTSSDVIPDASANDAGDSGRRGMDAGLPTVDSGCVGDGDCPFGVTMQDIAEVNPPKANTQGSCTDAELAMVKGRFADVLAAVSPTCASCLFTESFDMTNTQFFVWADTMHVNVSLENFGACMGSPLSGGNPDCGKAAEEVVSCLEALCPLDAAGNLTCCDITLQQCMDLGLQHDCKTYDQTQTAACGGAASLAAIKAKCFDSLGSQSPGIKLLCGGTGDAG